MEYKQKKEQILTQVEFTNLLSFNLVQNKLQRNFRSIVQALLLCQNKSDDAITKTETLEECLQHEKQRNSNEQKDLRENMHKLNEKLKALEYQMNHQASPTGTPGSHSAIQSLKDIKEANNKSDFSKKSVHSIEQGLPYESNSVMEKRLNDAMTEILGLKERMPNLQLMEGQFQTLKRDLSVLKGEMMTLGNKSAKNLKRQSIAVLSKQNTLKRNSNSMLPNQSSNAVLNNISNRELKVPEEVKQQNNSLQSQLEGLHIEVNTLNLCYQEIKNYVEDLRKKDFKYNSLLTELDNKFKKIQEESRKDAQSFEKQIKNITLELGTHSSSATKETSPKDHPEGKERASKQHAILPTEQNTVNFKNDLNDKLSKIQGSLVNFISESQFNRFKGQARTKMQQMQKNHDKLVCEYQQEIKKIYDMFINKDIDINRLGESIGLANESIKENNLQAERKNNITIAKIDQLKKHLQNLREDVQYYQTINAENLKKKDQSNKESFTAENGQSKEKAANSDPKAVEELKKYFNSKLHDQRAHLVGLIRDIEKKLQSSNGVNQEIANMWDKVNQINVFLTKKADGQDIKKNLVYLEKKINKIGSYLSKSDENTEDARVAKTNWFCLSCDKNLLGYKGKVGQHLVWQTMPLKGLVKAQSKKGLPSLKK